MKGTFKSAIVAGVQIISDVYTRRKDSKYVARPEAVVSAAVHLVSKVCRQICVVKLPVIQMAPGYSACTMPLTEVMYVHMRQVGVSHSLSPLFMDRTQIKHRRYKTHQVWAASPRMQLANLNSEVLNLNACWKRRKWLVVNVKVQSALKPYSTTVSASAILQNALTLNNSVQRNGKGSRM